MGKKEQTLTSFYESRVEANKVKVFTSCPGIPNSGLRNCLPMRQEAKNVYIANVTT